MSRIFNLNNTKAPQPNWVENLYQHPVLSLTDDKKLLGKNATGVMPRSSDGAPLPTLKSLPTFANALSQWAVLLHTTRSRLTTLWPTLPSSTLLWRLVDQPHLLGWRRLDSADHFRCLLVRQKLWRSSMAPNGERPTQPSPDGSRPSLLSHSWRTFLGDIVLAEKPYEYTPPKKEKKEKGPAAKKERLLLEGRRPQLPKLLQPRPLEPKHPLELLRRFKAAFLIEWEEKFTRNVRERLERPPFLGSGWSGTKTT